MKAYEESLKEHWDQYSILASAKEEEKLDIALNSIREGLDNNIISKITGLPVYRIEELRKNLKQ